MNKKKQYKVLCENYNNELKKAYKNAKNSPFDSFIGFNFFIKYMEFMRDYYNLGYNVIAAEDKDSGIKERENTPTRYESISKALELYNKWQNVDDEFFIYHETGGIENGEGLKINDKVQDWWFETKYKDKDKNMKEFDKATEKYKNDFFKYLNDHICEWWD